MVVLRSCPLWGNIEWFQLNFGCVAELYVGPDFSGQAGFWARFMLRFCQNVSGDLGPASKFIRNDEHLRRQYCWSNRVEYIFNKNDFLRITLSCLFCYATNIP